ncbi:PA2169 family four-helix-bundle protein [Brevundimonas diminuta]|uniref:PA2169 family four-helix-bundle protein n=1 Tax=Brevundimonas diminuta TaxID=293 RepID=UPI003207E53B
MSGNSHDIKVLNGLVEGLIDSADGYHQAAVEASDGAWRGWFEARAAERRRLADDFKAAVRERGGSPEEDGSILAKAQRAFMDVKNALLRNDASVMDTVERGETQLKARFDRALADEALSATTRETIRRAHAEVQQGHEQLRGLKQT